MYRDMLHYVRSRLDELGVTTFMQKKQMELLARYLLPDEEIVAALCGVYAECGDNPTSLPMSGMKSGFIVLTERHIIFAGKATFGGEHTARLPLDEVSRVVPYRHSSGSLDLEVYCKTNPSFRVEGAGTFDAVTEFARLTGKPTTDPAKEVPRDTPDAVASSEPLRTTQAVKADTPSATTDPSDLTTAEAPPKTPPKPRQTSTASSSSRKSQPGEGKLMGCLSVVVVVVIIAVIVGVISDACSGDDSGSVPDDRSLSPVQQGALRDAKTYGLDAIATANGISDTRLADLMVRETAYVLRALEQFAGNRQRYDIVWGSCYNRDIHTHRPRVLRSGLATYCGDVVDRLR